jgi:hypothetical protein
VAEWASQETKLRDQDKEVCLLARLAFFRLDGRREDGSSRQTSAKDRHSKSASKKYNKADEWRDLGQPQPLLLSSMYFPMQGLIDFATMANFWIVRIRN